MKRIAPISILLCGIALAPPALASPRAETYAVKVTVQLKFHHPQRIVGKVSSPLPACHRHRRVQIEAADGSTATELVTNRAGDFSGPPAGALAAGEDYRVKVFRKPTPSRDGLRRVCAGVVLVLHGLPPRQTR